MSLSLGLSLSLRSSGGAAAPPIDLTTLALRAYYRASYAPTTWSGTASAGSSGAKTLSVLGTSPSAGTAVNGFAPAAFSGTNQAFIDAADLAPTYITTTAYRIWVLFRSPSTSAPSGLPYNDTSLFVEGGGNWGVNFTTSGVSVYHQSSTRTTAACAADGNYHAAELLYDGANVAIRIDRAAPVVGSATATTGVITSGAMRIAANIGATRLTGSILEMAFVDTADAPSMAVPFADVIAAWNNRYGLGL